MALKICPNGHESEVAEGEAYCPICLAPYPVPTKLTDLHPTSGPPEGKIVVTLTGSGFGASDDDMEVFFGAMVGEIQSVTDTAITVIAPPGTGPVTVTLRTGAGTLTLEGAQGFTYVAAAQVTEVKPQEELSDKATITPSPPQITAIEPTRGPQSGGAVVTLTGSGFGGSAQGVKVLFGDKPGEIQSITDTALVVVAPAGSDTVPVRVTTPHGDSTPSRDAQFTYIAPLVPPILVPIPPHRKWQVPVLAALVLLIAAGIFIAPHLAPKPLKPPPPPPETLVLDAVTPSSAHVHTPVTIMYHGVDAGGQASRVHVTFGNISAPVLAVDASGVHVKAPGSFGNLPVSMEVRDSKNHWIKSSNSLPFFCQLFIIKLHP